MQEAANGVAYWAIGARPGCAGPGVGPVRQRDGLGPIRRRVDRLDHGHGYGWRNGRVERQPVHESVRQPVHQPVHGRVWHAVSVANGAWECGALFFRGAADERWDRIRTAERDAPWADRYEA